MKAKFLALTALVLGLASCQTDTINGVKVDANGEAPVTIQVALPEEATRAAGADSALGAIGNGINMNEYDIRFILEVYDANDALAKHRMVVSGDDTKASFPLRLVPGRHYSFVAWADFVNEGSQDDLHYNTHGGNTLGLTKVELKSGDAQALNDETRDAYTGVFNTADNNGEVFSSSTVVNITLTRPFAKLRVVTNDMNQLYSKLTQATVAYETEVYTSFNALSQQPGNAARLASKTVVYGSETIYANEPNNGQMTLFADYLFGTEEDVISFTLDVDDTTEFTIPTVNFNTSIPVQRNHLTTIYGPVLTDANNVTVTIDSDFEQPDNDVEYKRAGTAAELQEAISSASADKETHIVLTGDINLNDLLGAGIFSTRAASSASVTIASGKEVVLDIKDYTITGTDNETASFGMFNIEPGAKLTIEGTTGMIQLTATQNRGWNAYSSVISNQRGEFVLNGGTIEHLGGTDMAYGLDILTNTGAGDAKATINGGTVKSTYRAIRQFLNSTKATAELVVNGGIIDGRNNKSIWMQNANNSVNPGKLVVAENASLYGDVMVSGNGAPELAIELSVAENALEDGFAVIPSNIPAGYDIYVKNGNWVVEKGVVVDGNEVAICNAAGLKWVAHQVNTGADYFQGKTIVLTSDIDLNNEEWTPIGSAEKDHGFMGNFDGNGYTIKNLTIKNITPDSDSYVYAGLFGVTEGTDKDNQNTIKNLTIENVDIELGGHIVAAAIAYPYYTKIENVTVKGDISIKGGNYTSGVLAYTRRCVDATNIAIAANAGSVIEGNQTVGGVISDIQTNGGLTANYSNFSATGLTIKGTKCVGGISGIICNQTLNGATVKNVTIDCKDDRIGIVAGAEGGKSTIMNVVYENVTGATHVIGATYDGLIFVSTADELIAALEDGKGVFLSNDIKIDPANMSNAYGKTGINVKNGQTIDGNGHTLNIKGAGGTWDSGINTTGGVIKNITVTGSFRGIFINHTSDYSEKVILENVTIGGNGTVYTISCDQGLYQGIEATNCTFNGWTSFAKTAGEAKFTNCYFGEGSGYKYCRPYSNTEFVGCTFCPGYSVDTTRATVTFTDCTWE